jgi:dTDP-4-amino-4,6-dideoxygalactose transaminase
VATNDGELADRIRRSRNFGFTGVDQVDDIGINAKMSEASALMGLTSLESLSEFIAVNRRHYRRYYEALAGCAGVRLRTPAALQTTNCHYVVVEIDPEVAGLERDPLLQLLAAEGVLARRYFYPGCHRMKPYADVCRQGAAPLANTDRACDRVLQLPTGTSVEDGQVEAVTDLLQAAFARSDDIKRRMRG